MRGRNWACGVVLGLAGLAAGCGGGGGALVIRTADVQPASYPTVVGLREMDRIVQERSEGTMRLHIHAGATLGRGEVDTLSQTRDGDIHINRVSAAPLQQWAPRMGVLAMPYLFRDEDHMWAVLNGPIGDELLASLDGTGLVGLGWQGAGARSFYATRPLRSAEDLRGLQIRVQANEVMTAMVEALGGSARVVDYDEVYSALRNNVIQAAENNPPSYHTSGHYQAARHVLLDEHSRIPEVIVASQRWWDRLTPDQQAILRAAARGQQAVQRRSWTEMETEALAAVEAAGVTVVEPDEAARQAFREAMGPLYDRYRAEFGDLVDRIQAVP